MTQPSYDDLLQSVDEFISVLEQDENRFYVVLDLAHQLRDEFISATGVDNSATD